MYYLLSCCCDNTLGRKAAYRRKSLCCVKLTQGSVSIMVMKVMAASSLRGHVFDGKQKTANCKLGEAVNSQSLPRVVYVPQ